MRKPTAVLAGVTVSVILCSIPCSSSICEVHTSRITPAQEPLWVGYTLYVVYPGGCQIWDGELTAHYGYNIGASSRAWIVWSLESIPDVADVTLVEIELYTYPSDDPFEPDLHQTQYRRMVVHPWTVPVCEDLYDLLQGEIYVQHLTGTLEGLQRHTLGGSAAADVEYQLVHGDWFSIAVTGDPEVMGIAAFSGWGVAGPELIVTWEDSNPAETTGWGRIKALYRS